MEKDIYNEDLDKNTYDNDNSKDLMKIIRFKYKKLSKGQKLIAEYILKNYDKAAFMTASKLGISVGVSESTVVRFANELGFSGYPKLQKALQELIKNKLTTVQRLELSKDYISNGDALRRVIKADMENLRTTLEKIDENAFEEVLNLIFNANNIYIIGLRSSTALAEFLGFYLNIILQNVKTVSYGISDVFEQMINVKKGDIVIGIGFPRYATKTIDALDFSKNRGANVVAITDSHASPLASKADITLVAQSNMASFVDSLVAPLSVINALIIAVGMREKENISDIFNRLELIWKDYNVYSYNKNKSTEDNY